MSQWSFVLGAYAVMILATVGLLVWAYVTMRAAEAAADSLKHRD